MEMAWRIEWDHSIDAVRVTVEGVFDSVNFVRMSEDILAQPFWQVGNNVLFDYRECDVSREFDEIMRAALSTAEMDERIGSGKVALVVSNKSAFGSARQYHMLMERETAMNLQPFVDMTAAEAWISAE